MSRSIELAVEVPGTPEEAWEAIATGPGISSWFVPHQVEERAGGEVVMDFGSYGKMSATVTAWEPPHRVVFQSGGERPLAHEWLVEARDGGTCVVRLVASGFGSGEEWDGDFDGMTEGWGIFMQNLRLRLTHFRGRRSVAAATPTVTIAGPRPAAWANLCEALGVPGDLSEGDRLATSGAGVPPVHATVAGTIATDKATVYLLVLDSPSPGTGFIAAEGSKDQIACSAYLYLYDDGAEAFAQEWTAWLTSRFQPMTAPL